MNKLETLLAELRKLDAEATEGPWRWNTGEPDWPEDFEEEAWLDAPRDQSVLEYAGCGSHGCQGKRVNKELITTYRNETPKLIKVIEKLVEQRDELSGLHENGIQILKVYNKEIESILEGE